MASPDFNSDREGHRDHKYIVQKAWQGDLDKPILTSKGALKPTKKGRMFVKDEALANEIRTQYPKEYVVSRVSSPHPSDRGHKFFWGSWPQMPWKKKKKEGEHGVTENFVE